MKALEISQEKANAIIESREPKGVFYHKENDRYIGIDNSVGEAFVEEFTDLKTCIYWLENRGFEYFTELDLNKSLDELLKEQKPDTDRKTFEVIIKEELVTAKTVQASSKSEAIAMVQKMYDNEQIILDFDDLNDVYFYSDD
jgi:hypothetical protein